MSIKTKAGGLAGVPVLVSGAAGFLGSHLVGRLAALGCRVIGLIRPGSPPWRLAGRPGPRPELLPVDLAGLGADGRRELARQAGKARFVFHLAAAGVRPGPENGKDAEILAANVQGSLELHRLAGELGAERFINCGSCFEYGSGRMLGEDRAPAPANWYAATKTAAGVLLAAAARRDGPPLVTLRPFAVYGPFEAAGRLVPHLIRGALRGEAIPLTEGRQARDFVYAPDVAEAFIAAALRPGIEGGTFNVCTGRATTVREMAALVVASAGSAAPLRFGALPGRPGEPAELTGNPSRAREGIGFTAATGLSEGVARAIAWFRENAGRYAEYA